MRKAKADLEEAERSALAEETDDEVDDEDEDDDEEEVMVFIGGKPVAAAGAEAFRMKKRPDPLTASDDLEAQLNEGLAACEAEKIACEAELKQARAKIADYAQATVGLKAAYAQATAGGEIDEQRRNKLFMKQAVLEDKLKQCIAASEAAKAQSAAQLSNYEAMLNQEKRERAGDATALLELQSTKAALEKELDKSQAALNVAHASIEVYSMKADSAGIDESKGEAQIKALKAKVVELTSQAGTGGNLKLADVTTRINLFEERHDRLVKTHNEEIMNALKALQTTHTQSNADLAGLKDAVVAIKDGDTDDIASIATAIVDINATVQSQHTAVNDITRDATQNKADLEAELSQIKKKLEEITHQFAQARTAEANATLANTVIAAMKREMRALLESMPEGPQSFAEHRVEANEEQDPFKIERKFQWLTYQ